MRIIALIIVLFTTSVFASPNPKKIVKKSIKNGLLRSLDAKNVELIATLKSGTKNVKQYRMWRKRISKSQYSKTMSRFSLPRKITGQGVLLIERGKNSDGNDIRLYLPAFKRVRRIERSMQSGSFMGTAFYYSDLTSPEIENYKYTYEKLAKCPVTKNKKCHVILNTPINREVMERKGYAYYRTWVRTDNFMNDRLVGFNDKDKKVKILDFKKTVKVGKNKWLAKKIIAKDLRSKRWASFEIKEFEANKHIDDSIFTENFLKNP